MSLAVITTIGDNRATFKNTSIPAQNLGDINWTNFTSQGGNTYSLTIQGVNVEGNTISSTNIEVEIEGDINPTKVFWAVAKVLKTVLCPECQ